MMVNGLVRFKEYFRGFENQYVIIGGTACDILMDEAEMPFRVTKDIDIVIIVEAITKDFARKFWEYVKEAEYEHNNKSTGEPQFYRFSKPKSKEYPFMLEIFSRKMDDISLDEAAVLTPLPLDEELSSLSAILLNEAYYELLKSGATEVDEIPVLQADCIIPFKAKAWLDLIERKNQGESIDSKNIRKHKNDVFRLTRILREDKNRNLDGEVLQDMTLFLEKMDSETIDLKSLGIRNRNTKDLIDFLKEYYGII